MILNKAEDKCEEAAAGRDVQIGGEGFFIDWKHEDEDDVDCRGTLRWRTAPRVTICGRQDIPILYSIKTQNDWCRLDGAFLLQ